MTETKGSKAKRTVGRSLNRITPDKTKPLSESDYFDYPDAEHHHAG